jgi:rod shape-determining protein MreD
MRKEKILAYGLLFLLAIAAQKSLMPIMFGGQPLPDSVLMLVLALAITDGFERFWPWAVFAGLLYDLESATALGLHALIFILVTYFVSFFSRRFLVDMRSMGVAMLAFFIAAAALLSHLMVAAWMGWQANKGGRNFIGSFGGWRDLLWAIAYDALIFIFLFFIAKKLKKKKTVLISRG